MAATNLVVGRALAGLRAAKPEAALRALATTLFETIDAHPWVGTQLFRAPWEPAMLQIFERIGRQVQALGVSRSAQFTTASALFSYILGVSVQNAANARPRERPVDRADFLETVADHWQKLDADAYPFLREVSVQLREHDDLVEFLAGIDLILAGVKASV